MSRGFHVPRANLADVDRVKADMGIGTIDANRIVRFENIEGAIHAIKDIEDAKVVLLSMLDLIKRRA